MMIPGFIERHLDNLASGITRSPVLALCAFLLFVDSTLVKLFNVNLLSIDTNWIKEHLGLSGSLLMIAAYILIQEAVFPWIRFFSGLPVFFATELVTYKTLRRFGIRFGIRDEDFLVYAIVKNNSVAYEEYKRRKAEQAEGLKSMELSLGLLALAVVNFFVEGKVQSISIIALKWSLNLPAWVFLIGAAVFIVSLFFLLVNGLGVTRFGVKYFAIFNKKLYDDMEGFFELEQTEPSIEPRFRKKDSDGL